VKTLESCTSAKEANRNHSACASTLIILTLLLYISAHTFSWDTCLSLGLAEEVRYLIILMLNSLKLNLNATALRLS